MACALPQGITTGVLSALRPNGWTDILFSLMAYFDMSIPPVGLSLALTFVFASSSGGFRRRARKA